MKGVFETKELIETGVEGSGEHDDTFTADVS